MMDWGLIMDINAFLFISLSLMYAIRIYQKVRIRDFIWLVVATAYGTILRSMHLLRNFGFPVPDSLTVSRLFALFYILLFLGVRAYYRPIREMWNKTRSN